MLSTVAIFVVTFLSVTAADLICPDDFTWFQGSCYAVGHNKQEFEYAEDECNDKRGRLVEITSEEENEYVKGLLSSAFANDGETKVYIGHYLRTDYRDPRWVSYYYYDYLTFFDWVNPDWESDIDDGSDEYCATMSKDKNWSWVVGGCSDHLNYVCEREAIQRSCNQGSCYQMLYRPHQFSDIQDKCKEIGGNVLEINSQKEKDFVENYVRGVGPRQTQYFGNGHIWLGATDAGSEGKFRWLSTQEKIKYRNWSNGEPNNRNGANGAAENCVVLDYYRAFEWNDVICDGDHLVVCEIASTSGITG